MKLSHILYAIYFCIISSSFLLFFFGEKGLFAYQHLNEYEIALLKNITALQERNKDLANKLQWIKTDPEAVKLLARELGLYQKGESIIRIENYNNSENYYELGKIIKFNNIIMIKDNTLRLISLILSLIMLILFIIIDKVVSDNKGILNGDKTKLSEFYSKDHRDFKKA